MTQSPVAFGSLLRIALPLLLFGAVLVPRQALAANGATAVDDTDIDPVGDCKVDSWASFASNRDRIFNTSPGCVFDIGTPVDVSAGFQRMRSGGEWGSAATVKFRAFRIPAEGGKISVLFSAGGGYDITSGEWTTTLVNIPVTFQVLENVKLNLNGGWFFDHVDRLHWGTWGASIDWNVNERISIIGEVFGQFGHSIVDQPRLDDPRAQLILRLKPNENIDFDIAYGRNITGENANWITVGLNVRFNAFGEKADDPPRSGPRLVVRK
jgi:hypothetical protein